MNPLAQVNSINIDRLLTESGLQPGVDFKGVVGCDFGDAQRVYGIRDHETCLRILKVLQETESFSNARFTLCPDNSLEIKKLAPGATAYGDGSSGGIFTRDSEGKLSPAPNPTPEQPKLSVPGLGSSGLE